MHAFYASPVGAHLPLRRSHVLWSRLKCFFNLARTAGDVPACSLREKSATLQRYAAVALGCWSIAQGLGSVQPQDVIIQVGTRGLLLGLVCACGSVNHDSVIDAREADAREADARSPDATKCVPTPESLAARWSGENNTNDDKSLFNGTAHGQLAYTQGRFGSAFLLDGTTAYVTADNSDVLWPTGAFSIAAWVKALSIAADSYVLVKYGCGGSTACDGNYYALGVKQSGGAFFDFRIHGSASGIITLTATTANVVDSQWHYLVAERDSTAKELRLYVDGTRAASRAISGADLGTMGNVDGAADPVTLGGYIKPGTDTISAMFAGAADNLEYFTSALSDAEVSAIYAATDLLAMLTSPTCTCRGCAHFHLDAPPTEGQDAHHTRRLLALDLALAAACRSRGVPACNGQNADYRRRPGRHLTQVGSL